MTSTLGYWWDGITAWTQVSQNTLCYNTDSGEDCVPFKAALLTLFLCTNSWSRGNYLHLQTDFHFGAVWLSSDVAEWWVLSLLQQLLDSALVCPRLPLAQDCAFLVYSEMLRKFIHFSVISAFLKRLLRSLCAEDEEKKSPLLTLPCFLLLC